MLEQIQAILEMPPEQLAKHLSDLQAQGKHLEYRKAVFARAGVDLEFFAKAFFPHYCVHPFNEFHKSDFKTIKYGERKVRRARGAPRGYAKSTLKALIKPIHDLCYGLEKFIVIFSNTDTQSAAKLKDIRAELLTNRLLIRVYDIHFTKKTIAETAFEVHSCSGTVRFEAYGSGAEVRGIRFGSSRPSKIILDDVEHSEEVYNEALREKQFGWLTDVVSKLGDENTNIEIIGTILHKDSLLTKCLKNPMYDSDLYKAVISWSEREDLWENWREILRNLDNDNRIQDALAYYKANEPEMLKGVKVLWPEKESYYALMLEMLETGKRSFMKEKQNAPLGPDDKVFDRILYYRETVQNGKDGFLIEHTGQWVPKEHMQAYGTLDPSTGQTKAKKGKLGDFTCLLTGMSDSRGRLFVHRDWTKRVPPTKFIESIFQHHAEHAYLKFGVETNLYRNLLLPNIIAERERQEKKLGKKLHISFYDIENDENKEKRIFTLEPKVTNGWILFNRALSQEFMNQIDDFPHSDHDDCPDSLEMLWRLVNNRFKMSAVDVNPMAGR
jgi:predicted phage terminase large subunit-like protein